MVGELLLSRYMIGFEGAAFLILAGIAGAVILAKREHTPGPLPQAQPDEPAAIATSQHTYACPMHSDVHQSQPGHCPTCGMSLMAGEETPGGSQASAQGTPGHEQGGDV